MRNEKKAKKDARGLKTDKNNADSIHSNDEDSNGNSDDNQDELSQKRKLNKREKDEFLKNVSEKDLATVEDAQRVLNQITEFEMYYKC